MSSHRLCRDIVENALNKLPELKTFLDMVAKTKRRAQFQIDYDGERFHWTVPVKNMTGSQYAALVSEPSALPVTQSTDRKEHHGS
jgi:hypothetical protein